MPEHTIAENLTRLQIAKTAIANAITAKGGTVTSGDGLEDFASDIGTITNQYTAGDEGKVVSNGALVQQTARANNITENGTYDTTLNNSVTVYVPSYISDLTNLIERDFTSIDIPNTVTSIGDSAFRNCTSLTSIAIPSSVTSIGDYAVYNCTSLTSITIPSSVTSINTYAFGYCTSLTSIAIPSSVTSINASTFSNCTSLTSIAIPSSVTSIDNYAFSNCTSLTSITIPSSVTSIAQKIFFGCTNLTTITINKSEGSITGAPWGATNATVVWTG